MINSRAKRFRTRRCEKESSGNGKAATRNEQKADILECWNLRNEINLLKSGWQSGWLHIFFSAARSWR
jgi:hypothetical protein